MDERLNLSKLIGNAFLKQRMNALALKQRLCEHLCHRKFKLKNVERAYHNTMLGAIAPLPIEIIKC